MKYEIYRRSSDQYRPGQFAFAIEGIDAEVTVDPTQFLPKAQREALAEGVTDPAKLAIRAEEICQMYAERALQRRIERLQAGHYVPGSRGIDAGPAAEIGRKPRRSEKESVQSFLNRGKLAGLSDEQRKERAAKKAQRQDCDAEWRERRLALIAAREKECLEWQEKLLANPFNPKATRAINLLLEEIKRLKAPILCASHGFQSAYSQYLQGGINLASDDIRIWPLMTNTTADSQRDTIDTFSEVTTVDEFDGSGYSSGGLALDSQAVTEDDANDRAEFDAADETVTALGAGTRSIQGVALGKFNTNTAGSRILHWIEFASNKTPDGSDFTFQFNAEGILNAQDG